MPQDGEGLFFFVPASRDWYSLRSRFNFRSRKKCSKLKIDRLLAPNFHRRHFFEVAFKFDIGTLIPYSQKGNRIETDLCLIRRKRLFASIRLSSLSLIQMERSLELANIREKGSRFDLLALCTIRRRHRCSKVTRSKGALDTSKSVTRPVS